MMAILKSEELWGRRKFLRTLLMTTCLVIMVVDHATMLVQAKPLRKQQRMRGLRHSDAAATARHAVFSDKNKGDHKQHELMVQPHRSNHFSKKNLLSSIDHHHQSKQRQLATFTTPFSLVWNIAIGTDADRFPTYQEYQGLQEATVQWLSDVMEDLYGSVEGLTIGDLQSTINLEETLWDPDTTNTEFPMYPHVIPIDLVANWETDDAALVPDPVAFLTTMSDNSEVGVFWNEYLMQAEPQDSLFRFTQDIAYATSLPEDTTPNPTTVEPPDTTEAPVSATTLEPTSANTNNDGDDGAATGNTPTALPADDTASSPTTTPADDTASTPTATPVDDTASSPTAAPADDTASTPTATPVDDTVGLPTATPADETQAGTRTLETQSNWTYWISSDAVIADRAPTEAEYEGLATATENWLISLLADDDTALVENVRVRLVEGIYSQNESPSHLVVMNVDVTYAADTRNRRQLQTLPTVDELYDRIDAADWDEYVVVYVYSATPTDNVFHGTENAGVAAYRDTRQGGDGDGDGDPAPNSPPTEEDTIPPDTTPSVTPVDEDTIPPAAGTIPTAAPVVEDRPSVAPVAEAETPTTAPGTPTVAPVAETDNPTSSAPGTPTTVPTSENPATQEPSTQVPSAEIPATDAPDVDEPVSSTPSLSPSGIPSETPASGSPSTFPSSMPSMTNSTAPSTMPSASSAAPSTSPAPSDVPSAVPSLMPSASSAAPSISPAPSDVPSAVPSLMPSTASAAPSSSGAPSDAPSDVPSMMPSNATNAPSSSSAPSDSPSFVPSLMPSTASAAPSISEAPSDSPSSTPSMSPSVTASEPPSFNPTITPSPTVAPTLLGSNTGVNRTQLQNVQTLVSVMDMGYLLAANATNREPTQSEWDGLAAATHSFWQAALEAHFAKFVTEFVIVDAKWQAETTEYDATASFPYTGKFQADLLFAENTTLFVTNSSITNVMKDLLQEDVTNYIDSYVRTALPVNSLFRETSEITWG